MAALGERSKLLLSSFALDLGVSSTLKTPPDAEHYVDSSLKREMHNGRQHAVVPQPAAPTAPTPTQQAALAPSELVWSWDIEHADRKREAKADAGHGAHILPFQVDRRVLKDVIKEKMGADAARIGFLSAGTFHKAYLVTLVDARQLVARVARRFMPRLKTESEVATMQYLRDHTTIPVPTIYHHDPSPYNRLGGEYILMSKAPGIPLSKVYHSMAHGELVRLLNNMAELVIPLFAHRFSQLGSLYVDTSSSNVATPRATQLNGTSFPFARSLSMSSTTTAVGSTSKVAAHLEQHKNSYHVGPIISWPFFGSGRGEVAEINRGPWTSTQAYLASCAEREIQGVISENQGKAAPHRLHLDPAEIQSSRHHHLNAVPGDESDDSDEWGLSESEDEDEGPGDLMYRDYRRMQRTTFLVAHTVAREQTVRAEMGRWIHMMERLGVGTESSGAEEFGIDAHDLSLENVFVDELDHSKISCIIDWESTTTRPLWASAHLPAFLQSSPFTATLFRQAVNKLASAEPGVKMIAGKPVDTSALAREWLHYERVGSKLRAAHRFGEWDGWEEGLIDDVLGPVELEEEWLKDMQSRHTRPLAFDGGNGGSDAVLPPSIKRGKPRIPFAKELEKEQILNPTGDYCAGRGGELGRRLEAWLVAGSGSESGGEEEQPVARRDWVDDGDEQYDAEAE